MALKHITPLVLVVTLGLTAMLLPPETGQASNNTEQRYYESGKRSLVSGQYRDAIDFFNSLEKLYPQSHYLPQVQIEKSFAYYKTGNFDDGIALAERFLTNNPGHAHTAYAHYLAGLMLYDKTIALSSSSRASTRAKAKSTSKAALAHFSELIGSFPNSQYAQDARPKSTQLLENLVLNEESPQLKEKIENGRDTYWLLGQPAHYYTVQLMRDPDMEALQTIVNENQEIQDKAIIYEDNSPSGAVYTLLYGVYPNQGDAEQVSKKLPPTLRDHQPWTRQISSIQAEIRKNRLLMVSPIALTTLNPPSSDVSEIIAHPVEPVNETASHPQFETVTQTTQIQAYREDWLTRQNPQHYTIQLTGMREEIGIIDFIDRYRLEGKAAYFRSTHNDKDWFSLLYGSYPNKQVAQNAAKQVRKELGLKDAWIRPYKDIQKIIRQSH